MIDSNREKFEKLPHIKSRLDDVFFIDGENTYLPHQWDDADSVNNMHFINGAWYSWQARVPAGYKLVPVEPSGEMYVSGFEAKRDGLNTIEIYKAMIGAAP